MRLSRRFQRRGLSNQPQAGNNRLLKFGSADVSNLDNSPDRFGITLAVAFCKHSCHSYPLFSSLAQESQR